MFVDPLAEKYPGWTPYHYVHNNPVNMVDPTGMEADGWIQWSTRNGDKQMTYDPQVLTEQGARDKGYTNVESYADSGYYNAGNETYKLNTDGTVQNEETKTSVDVGFKPFKASDGTYFSENNELKSLATGYQNAGDALTYAGLGASVTGVGAPVGATLMAAGSYVNLAGTFIESAYLFSQGKKMEAVSKMGVSAFFAILGGAGVSASEKALEKKLGKEAVEQGLNNSTETIINGSSTIMEKSIGKDAEKK